MHRTVSLSKTAFAIVCTVMVALQVACVPSGAPGDNNRGTGLAPRPSLGQVAESDSALLSPLESVKATTDQFFQALREGNQSALDACIDADAFRENMGSDVIERHFTLSRGAASSWSQHIASAEFGPGRQITASRAKGTGTASFNVARDGTRWSIRLELTRSDTEGRWLIVKYSDRHYPPK